jgi:hypothetical protein
LGISQDLKDFFLQKITVDTPSKNGDKTVTKPCTSKHRVLHKLRIW